ncbi:hypothetical protein ACLOJK_019131 [Asimina triloba]
MHLHKSRSHGRPPPAARRPEFVEQSSTYRQAPQSRTGQQCVQAATHQQHPPMEIPNLKHGQKIDASSSSMGRSSGSKITIVKIQHQFSRPERGGRSSQGSRQFHRGQRPHFANDQQRGQVGSTIRSETTSVSTHMQA